MWILKTWKHSDKNIAAITLTGSDAAGRSIAQLPGKPKKTVMELGGSDAYIILDDVDLEKQLT
jgi:succinate-semialdehyde dehydrogenase/glutarate-semialdehyde dehydrogenase